MWIQLGILLAATAVVVLLVHWRSGRVQSGEGDSDGVGRTRHRQPFILEVLGGGVQRPVVVLHQVVTRGLQEDIVEPSPDAVSWSVTKGTEEMLLACIPPTPPVGQEVLGLLEHFRVTMNRVADVHGSVTFGDMEAS